MAFQSALEELQISFQQLKAKIWLCKDNCSSSECRKALQDSISMFVSELNIQKHQIYISSLEDTQPQIEVIPSSIMNPSTPFSALFPGPQFLPCSATSEEFQDDLLSAKLQGSACLEDCMELPKPANSNLVKNIQVTDVSEADGGHNSKSLDAAATFAASEPSNSLPSSPEPKIQHLDASSSEEAESNSGHSGQARTLNTVYLTSAEPLQHRIVGTTVQLEEQHNQSNTQIDEYHTELHCETAERMKDPLLDIGGFELIKRSCFESTAVAAEAVENIHAMESYRIDLLSSNLLSPLTPPPSRSPSPPSPSLVSTPSNTTEVDADEFLGRKSKEQSESSDRDESPNSTGTRQALNKERVKKRQRPQYADDSSHRSCKRRHIQRKRMPKKQDLFYNITRNLCPTNVELIRYAIQTNGMQQHEKRAAYQQARIKAFSDSAVDMCEMVRFVPIMAALVDTSSGLECLARIEKRVGLADFFRTYEAAKKEPDDFVKCAEELLRAHGITPTPSDGRKDALVKIRYADLLYHGSKTSGNWQREYNRVQNTRNLGKRWFLLIERFGAGILLLFPDTITDTWMKDLKLSEVSQLVRVLEQLESDFGPELAEANSLLLETNLAKALDPAASYVSNKEISITKEATLSQRFQAAAESVNKFRDSGIFVGFSTDSNSEGQSSPMGNGDDQWVGRETGPLVSPNSGRTFAKEQELFSMGDPALSRSSSVGNLISLYERN